jgi:serine/threonine-protein kinase
VSDEGTPPAESQDPARIAHFRILGRLGAGGMGVVYRAEDEKLRRVVALKLLPDPKQSEERRQRFLREARSAAAITHPNVAAVYAIDEDAGRVYIAMELVEGDSLRDRLSRGPLGVGAATDVGVQIAKGLAAAHDKGIVHRDLKPENVMITPEGVVKLLDFGLAKTAATSTDPGNATSPMARTETVVTSDDARVMGTPEYMSPEQAMGEPLDARSDVFSFGIVMYEMLAGVRPFGGVSTGAVLVAIARDAPAPLREKAPYVDPRTADVVMRCLARAREARFANGAEIAAALGAGVSSTAPTLTQNDVAPVAREGVSTKRAPARPLLAIAVGVVGLLSVGAVVVARRAPANGGSSPVAAAAADAGAAAGSGRGVPMTDHPLPSSSVAEAVAAYAAARSGLRSGADGRPLLHRATQLDPLLAAAHLHEVLWEGCGYHAGGALGEPYRRAKALEGALDDRDRTLLPVAEAASLDDPDRAIAELTRLEASDPRDAELPGLRACYAWYVHHDAVAKEAEARALELDPDFAGVVVDEIWAQFRSEWPSYQAGAPAMQRCVDRWPTAVTCRRLLALHRAEVGDCAGELALAREVVRLQGDSATGYALLAQALVATGASEESSATAFASMDAHVEPSAFTPRGVGDIEQAIAWGDFEAAERRLTELDRRIATEVDGEWHAGVAIGRAELALEEGAPERALAVLDDHIGHAAAWTESAGPWVPLRRAYLRHQLGRLSDADFERERDALTRDTWWARQSAQYVRTAGEATALLEGDAGVGEPAARVPLLVLAGRPAEAVSALATGLSCDVVAIPTQFGYLRTSVTFPAMRARLALGEALEATGDRDGACKAYGFVLQHWGHARPRSVTGGEARAHATKLGCKL